MGQCGILHCYETHLAPHQPCPARGPHGVAPRALEEDFDPHVGHHKRLGAGLR